MGRVLRVLGPAGYGKTSLVSRWVGGDDRAVAWLDVESVQDDPVVLLDELRTALAEIVELPRVSSVQAGADHAGVVAIRRALAGVDPEAIPPFVLVLDDAHHLSQPLCGWMVETLARALPPSSTLVLVGRAHHDHGAIARLRLTPGVVDVTVDDLAFDESESDRLFATLGVDIDRSEVARLLELTEGWPAGVSLAAHGVRMGSQPFDIGDDVAIVDYLRSEWTGQLDPDDLGFLREAACLRRFTSAMCDEVLERVGSADVLRRLHRDETVVFPLDRRDEWYRLHPLLSRWLSADLRVSDSARWAEIHRRASRCWESKGDIDRAVEHALTVGDLQLTEQLVVSHGSARFPQGRAVTVRAWLEAFPGDYVRTSPGLSALRCILAVHEGDSRGVLQWIGLHDVAVEDATSRAAERGEAGPAGTELRWWSSVMHAAFDERPTSESIPMAEEACANVGGGPWAPFGFLTLGGLRFLDGDVVAARDALESGRLRAELSDNPLLQVHCLSMLSIVLDCLGDRGAAAGACMSARQMMEDRHLHFLPVTAPKMAVTALAHARAGRFDDARMHIDAARRALSGLATVLPWINVAARIPLIGATLLLDDQTTATELLREAEHHARLEPAHEDRAASGAMACLSELRSRVESMHRPATGASALTEAELRVLQHLPSHLSLTDIAGVLYLSRNTVKSHAASIYRKLGAQNRRDAVDQAAAAGLLDGAALDRRP